MPTYSPSLQERKLALIASIKEDCGCGGGGGGMMVGSDGFEGSHPSEGPKAGFDPILSKALKKVKRRKPSPLTPG